MLNSHPSSSSLTPRIIKVKRAAEDPPLAGILCERDHEHFYYQHVPIPEARQSVPSPPNPSMIPYEELVNTVKVLY